MGNETSELERQIAELRAALEKMDATAQAKDVERGAEIADIREMVTGVQATLDEVKRVLLGNSDSGIVHVIDKLMLTVEGLGRLFERLHLEGQQRDKGLAALTEKARADNAWREMSRLLLDTVFSLSQSLSRFAQHST